MKLIRSANRRGFPLSCEHCFSPIKPGGRYFVDTVTRQTFCTAACAKKLDRELTTMGLPRFDTESQAVVT